MTTIAQLLGSEQLVEHLKTTILNGVQHQMFHKMCIYSTLDEDTFGQLMLVNGVNGKRYLFDVYKDEAYDAEDGELWHSIFLSNVVAQLDFEQHERVLDRIGDALEQTTLQQLMTSPAFDQVLQHIVRFEQFGTAFCIDIPQQAQRMDMNYLLIDEEITRMIHAILNNTLTKNDIVDFGKLLLLYNKPLNALSFSQLHYFKEPFQKVLQSVLLTAEEMVFLKIVAEACKIDL